MIWLHVRPLAPRFAGKQANLGSTVLQACRGEIYLKLTWEGATIMLLFVQSFCLAVAVL
jgi:hypothetical protein